MTKYLIKVNMYFLTELNNFVYTQKCNVDFN